MQHSTTLNRKYVKQPTSRTATSARATTARLAAERSAAAARTTAATMKSDTMKRRQALAEQMNRERLQSMRTTTRPRVATPATTTATPVPKPEPQLEPKTTKATKTDRAAESAMRAVATMHSDASSLKPSRMFTAKRIALALFCSAIIVIPLAFIISDNISDFPPTASASQIGFKPSYPSYTPRGYNRSSVITESGMVSITFTDADGSSYTLTEELSSWDSDTLERNDVKDTFSDYSIVTEGGLTLFISGSDCMWVSGGKKYYIDTTSGSLTKKQLKSIAASL